MQSTRIGLRVQYLAMEVAASAQTDEVSFPRLIMANLKLVILYKLIFDRIVSFIFAIHIFLINRFQEPFDVKSFPHMNIFKFVLSILQKLILKYTLQCQYLNIKIFLPKASLIKIL